MTNSLEPHDASSIPQAVLAYRGDPDREHAGIPATPGALAALRATRPWALTMAILAFVLLGFMVLGGVSMALAGIIGGGPGDMIGFMVGMALFYLLIAGAGMVPAVYLLKYANAIGRLNRNGDPEDLEAALTKQKSFWKSMTLIVIAIVGLYLLMIVAMIGFGGFMATRPAPAPGPAAQPVAPPPSAVGIE